MQGDPVDHGSHQNLSSRKSLNEENTTLEGTRRAVAELKEAVECVTSCAEVKDVLVIQPNIKTMKQDDVGSASDASADHKSFTSAEQSAREGECRPHIGIGQRRFNLFFFIWLKGIYAYDSGAFSAAIGFVNGISNESKLSTTQQGMLISSVFLGSFLGCLVSGHLFSLYTHKRVLILSSVVHTIATVFFVAFSTFFLRLTNRFVLGITLSFILVYVPVWVEEFAPKSRKSIWMGIQNAVVPLGITLGYLACVYFAFYQNIGWRYAFYIKLLLMLPTIVCFLPIETQSINVDWASTTKAGSTTDTRHASDWRINISSDVNASNNTPEGAPPRLQRVHDFFVQKLHFMWGVLSPLLCNLVFMLNVAILCVMYFIATGLQNFLTQYLREEPFNASIRTITVGFGVTVVAAPMLGVMVGAVALDLCGGYNNNLFRVCIFGLCWAVSGAIFATACIFLTKPVPFIVILSLMLFCGGAIIPFATGLTMSSLPKELRPFGAAFSQIIYNIFGNFSGPMVCSVVADMAGRLKYGIVVLLLSTNIGVILMSVLLFSIIRDRREMNLTSLNVVCFSNVRGAG